MNPAPFPQSPKQTGGSDELLCRVRVQCECQSCRNEKECEFLHEYRSFYTPGVGIFRAAHCRRQLSDHAKT
jgi:hypothetical protein